MLSQAMLRKRPITTVLMVGLAVVAASLLMGELKTQTSPGAAKQQDNADAADAFEAIVPVLRNPRCMIRRIAIPTAIIRARETTVILIPCRFGAAPTAWE
jgi:hypothetical protein